MNVGTEYDNAVFPIGMVINGGSTAKGPTYDIVDLRDMELLYSSELAAKEIAPVVAELNSRLRQGMYEDDFDIIRKHAATLCSGEVIADNTAALGELTPPEVAVLEAQENTTENSAAMPSWTPPAMPVLATLN